MNVSRLLALPLTAIIVTLGTITSAQAVPTEIPYQLRIVENNVNYDGTGYFRFSLLDENSTVLWHMDGTLTTDPNPAGSISLTVDQGLATVILGDSAITNMTVLDTTTIGGANELYLRVWFSDDDVTYEQLTPDQRIYPATFAKVADIATVAGTVLEDAIDSDSIADGTITGSDITANPTLSNNLTIGGSSEADDDFLAFDDGTQRLTWDDSMNRFQLTQGLDVNGQLGVLNGAIVLENNQSLAAIPSSGLGFTELLKLTTSDQTQISARSDKAIYFKIGVPIVGTFDSDGHFGIGTLNPDYPLEVSGDAFISGRFLDSSEDAGNSGQVLASTGTGTNWASLADNDPTNELQDWSTLPGIPSDFADGVDQVDDADANPVNELQSILFDGTNLSLSSDSSIVSITSLIGAFPNGSLASLDDPSGQVTNSVNVSNGGLVSVGTGNPLSGFNPEIILRDTDDTGLGGPRAVDVQGSYAYLVDSTLGLVIYDVSDPGNLTLRDSDNTGLTVPQSVTVQGDYAYVVDSSSTQLLIFDVSDPDNITPKDTEGTGLSFPVSVDVEGNYAYVVDLVSNELSIFDVSDPDLIVPKDSQTVGTGLQSVSVQGTFAYVVGGTTGLSIFDVSDPDNIVAKDTDNTGLTNPRSIGVEGDFAYVVDSTNGVLSIFDVSDPDLIVAKDSEASGLSSPKSVVVRNNVAYVVDTSTPALAVFDVSDPDLIVPKDSESSGLSGPQGLAVQGAFVFIADLSNDSITSFEVAPSLTVEGSMRVSGGLYDSGSSIGTSGQVLSTTGTGTSWVNLLDNDPTNELQSITFDGTNLSLSDDSATVSITTLADAIPGGTFSGLNDPTGTFTDVLNVADSNIVAIGTNDPFSDLDPNIDLIGSRSNNLSNPTDFVIQGTKAYIVDSGIGSIFIYDISDPNNIIVQDIESASLTGPQSIAVQGNYAYVLDAGLDVLAIFDISDPTNIVPMDTDSTGISIPSSIAVSGNYAYVVDLDSDALSIFDISNPSNIVPLDSETGSLFNPEDVIVSGDYAYVIDIEKLAIFDVSDPSNIVAKDTSIDAGVISSGRSLTKQGDIVFTAHFASDSYSSFNVSDPDNITVIINQFSLNKQNPRSFFSDENFVYFVSEEDREIVIYEYLPEGFLSREVTYNYGTLGPSLIASQGRFIYVVSEEADLFSIFEIAPALMIEGSMRLTGSFYDSKSNIGSNGQILSSRDGGTEWIDLPSYDLSLSGDTLSISGGGTSADLSQYFMGDGSESFSGNLIVTGDVGIGETNPITTTHIKNVDTGFTGGIAADLLVEDADAALALLSNNGGSTGSFISMLEVDSSDGSVLDFWQIIRETTTGTGTSDFSFRYFNGSSTNTVFRLTTAGDLFIDGSLNPTSDRNAKEAFETIDPREILDRVIALPLNTWQFIDDKDETRHIGPFAQDFYAAFDVGYDDKSISTTDADGVALAAIQGLNQKVESENAILRQENAELRRRLEKLESMVSELAN